MCDKLFPGKKAVLRKGTFVRYFTKDAVMEKNLTHTGEIDIKSILSEGGEEKVLWVWNGILYETDLKNCEPCTSSSGSVIPEAN